MNQSHHSILATHPSHPLKRGQIQTISAVYRDYASQITSIDVRYRLASELAQRIEPYIDVRSEYRPELDEKHYYGSVNVIALDTEACVVNDKYTYRSQHFTQADIDAALLNTFPERFI